MVMISNQKHRDAENDFNSLTFVVAIDQLKRQSKEGKQRLITKLANNLTFNEVISMITFWLKVLARNI